eukprot:TRINITY_DN14722_c0_g1_i1.p1 TRINITY_DN14722_c0_g1~~TRINITY_DN14722_c0_g1_i1.p1  ORF type:complete len:122 (-),score=23.39 TRINITY_DN14722_c0_g1_i1:7-345(-)
MSDFSVGLFDLCHHDMNTLIITLFVPQYQIGKNLANLEGRPFVIWDCLCAEMNVAFLNRIKIRNKEGMLMNYVNDCLSIVFCPFCSILQNTAQINRPSFSTTVQQIDNSTFL